MSDNFENPYEGENYEEDYGDNGDNGENEEEDAGSEADDFIVRKDEQEEEDDEEGDDDDEEGEEGKKKVSKKKNNDDESDEEEDEEEQLLPVNIEAQHLVGKKSLAHYRELKGSERKTIPILRKFEKVLLITTRVKQLNNGAKTKIPRSRLKSTDSIKIAEQELEERVIPNKILRVQPLAKTYEILDISYFKYIDRD